MLNWMSENPVAAKAGRAGASTSCSKSVAWESRKAVMAPVLRADRRLSAVLVSVSASMAGSFQRAGGGVGGRGYQAGPGPGRARPGGQQKGVSARRGVHDPLEVEYSWAGRAGSPAGGPGRGA